MTNTGDDSDVAQRGCRRRSVARWATVALLGVGLAVALAFTEGAVRGWAAGVMSAALSGVLVSEVGSLLSPPSLPPEPPADPLMATLGVGQPNYVRVPRDDPDMPPETVLCSGHSVRVTVEALTDQSVILQAMWPVIVSRNDPPPGRRWPHRGVVEMRRYRVYLDETDPRLVPDDTGPGAPDFPFKVARGDPEVFEVTALVDRYDVRWFLELEWVCGGRQGTTRVDFAGEPVRTVPVPAGASRGGWL